MTPHQPMEDAYITSGSLLHKSSCMTDLGLDNIWILVFQLFIVVKKGDLVQNVISYSGNVTCTIAVGRFTFSEYSLLRKLPAKAV